MPHRRLAIPWCALLAGCADGASGPGVGSERLTVTPASIACRSGERVEIVAGVRGAEFTVSGEGAWLAEVRREAGAATLTCEGVGRGAVAVSAAGATTTVPVTVAAPEPGLVRIAVAPASLALVTAATEALRATVTTSLGFASTAARYTSSDTAVAAVDSLSGVVRAVGPGVATVTVRAHADPAARVTVPVTVTRGSLLVSSIVPLPFSLSLAVGESGRLGAQVFLAPGAPASTPRTVTFVSSSPAVVRVSADGTVRGISAGIATVTVAPTVAPALRAPIVITVRDPAP